MPSNEAVVTPTGDTCTCMCISLFREAKKKHKNVVVDGSETRVLEVVHDKKAKNEGSIFTGASQTSQIKCANGAPSPYTSQIQDNSLCSWGQQPSVDKIQSAAEINHLQQKDQLVCSMCVPFFFY